MKKVILISLLFLIFSGFSNAQGTKTINEYWKDVGPIVLECYCGDAYIGYMEGAVDLHVVVHSMNGLPVWMKMMGTKSTLVGQDGEIKGETFTDSEMDKFFGPPDVWSNHIIVHCNLKGDRGHHFIWSGYIDFVNDEVVRGKAICPGGNK
jgi:hypothetical protein